MWKHSRQRERAGGGDAFRKSDMQRPLGCKALQSSPVGSSIVDLLRADEEGESWVRREGVKLFAGLLVSLAADLGLVQAPPAANAREPACAREASQARDGLYAGDLPGVAAPANRRAYAGRSFHPTVAAALAHARFAQQILCCPQCSWRAASCRSNSWA